MHERNNTLVRLRQFGLHVDTNCYFCINRLETQEHLFLECSFMQKILGLLFHNKCAKFPNAWPDLMNLLTAYNPSDLCETIRILGFQICCYSVWLERNNRYHNSIISSMDALATKCRQLLKCRLLSSSWFRKSCNKNHNLEIWIRDV